MASDRDRALRRLHELKDRARDEEHVLRTCPAQTHQGESAVDRLERAGVALRAMQDYNLLITELAQSEQRTDPCAADYRIPALHEMADKLAEHEERLLMLAKTLGPEQAADIRNIVRAEIGLYERSERISAREQR